MKFTAQRETTIGDVEPGEFIAPQDGGSVRLMVDEVRRRRDSIEVYCLPEGSESSRRSMLPFKSLDEKITVEAGAEDGAEMLSLMFGLLTKPGESEQDFARLDETKHELVLTLGTRVVGKTASRVWKVTIEA